MKKLAKALNLSQGFLRGLAGGSGVKSDELLRINAANGLREVAKRTGYNSMEHAGRAIEKEFHLLFQSSEQYAARLLRYVPKYKESRKQILLAAINQLRAGNGAEFNKILSSDISFKRMQRTFQSTPDKKLIDTFRSLPKANRQAAKALLKRKTGRSVLIIVPQKALDAEIKARAERYGVTGGLFWEAAKKINPKIRPNGLVAGKRKKRAKRTRGNQRTQMKNLEITAEINHIAEQLNQSYRNKVLKNIQEQEKFYISLTERQVLASKYLNKNLDQA